MADYIEIKKQDYTFFGEGSSLSGKFNLKGPTRIASEIEGEITMTDTSDLTIEDTGSFHGTLNCHNLEIYGHFDGKVNSTGKIEIFPSAQVHGEIKAKSLVIGPGAKVNMNGHTLESKSNEQ